MGEYIYLIIGPSGSGKTTLCNYLGEMYGLKQLESYTTRQPRFPGERGHVFVDKTTFDALPNKCAYTFFDKHGYCATSEQVDEVDLYVIDPPGVKYFMEHYIGEKIPRAVLLTVKDQVERMKKRGNSEEFITQRCENDDNIFKDYINVIKNTGINCRIFNTDDYTVEETAEQIYEYIKEGQNE